MLHKLTASSATSAFPPTSERNNVLHLTPVRQSGPVSSGLTKGSDLVQIAARRCSAFCAEAAVLVLVFGLLDYFMMKGRIEIAWIAGALLISVLLLMLSIVIELSAHRWIKAHP